MGGLFSRGKGGKGDFDIVIGQPDYNSFQKVTDAAMVKDYLQTTQAGGASHGPSENAGPASNKTEALPPPPAPREGQGEKAASKKTSSAEDDDDLTEDEEDTNTEEAHSNDKTTEPAAVRQDDSGHHSETEDS